MTYEEFLTLINGGASGVVQPPRTTLGDLTAEIAGVRDTPGTLTSVVNERLDTPPSFAMFIQRFYYRENDPALYDPGWLDVHEIDKAKGLRLGVVWSGMGYSQFAAMVGYHGLADHYFDAFRGLYVHRQNEQPAGTQASPDWVLEDPLSPAAIQQTPTAEITTVLPVAYGEGAGAGDFVLEDAAEMQERYGRRTGRTLTLPWITNTTLARMVARRWYKRWWAPRLTTVVRTSWSGFQVDIGDRVEARVPLMDVFGYKRILFEVRGLTVDLASASVDVFLVEGEPVGLTFKDGYRILARRLGTYSDGYGLATMTVDGVPILGELAAAVALDGRTMAGPLTLEDGFPVFMHRTVGLDTVAWGDGYRMAVLDVEGFPIVGDLGVGLTLTGHHLVGRLLPGSGFSVN